MVGTMDLTTVGIMAGTMGLIMAGITSAAAAVSIILVVVDSIILIVRQVIARQEVYQAIILQTIQAVTRDLVALTERETIQEGQQVLAQAEEQLLEQF